MRKQSLPISKDLQFLNKHFLCVFNPYQMDLFDHRKRFLISINQVSKYIGSENVLSFINRLSSCKMDKCIIKYRNHGRLEIYVK